MVKWRDERGQSLVEFALVLPILALFLLGTIDVGRILWAHNTIAAAARDAARYASVGDANSDLQQVITSETSALQGGVSWSVNPADTRTSGDTVQVSISYPVSLLDPLMAAFLGSHFTVASTVTMRVE